MDGALVMRAPWNEKYQPCYSSFRGVMSSHFFAIHLQPCFTSRTLRVSSRQACANCLSRSSRRCTRTGTRSHMTSPSCSSTWTRSRTCAALCTWTYVSHCCVFTLFFFFFFVFVQRCNHDIFFFLEITIMHKQVLHSNLGRQSLISTCALATIPCAASTTRSMRTRRTIATGSSSACCRT